MLIVDDHPVVRQGLRAVVNEAPDMHVLSAVSSPADALLEVEQVRPDVAIVDISLGGTDGLQLTKALSKKDVPVLVLSIHDEAHYARRALRAGAHGYIMKDAAVDTLLDAIRTVAAGGVHLSEAMRPRLLDAEGSVHESPVDRLTDRELQVLRLVGRGATTRDIAETLGVSIKTIETHRHRIKEKLQLTNANEVVHFAVRWVEDQA